MQEARTLPNAFTYSSAITSCEQGSQWRMALLFFDAMRRMSVKADAITFGVAASACAKTVQWQHALALLQTMRSVLPSSGVGTTKGSLELVV
eukprot:Skav211052  [mRNA]  locus=scaffold6454:90203:90478:- [translate_table: standard]